MKRNDFVVFGVLVVVAAAASSACGAPADSDRSDSTAQADGTNGEALRDAGTANSPISSIEVQADGNLVVHGAASAAVSDTTIKPASSYCVEIPGQTPHPPCGGAVPAPQYQYLCNVYEPGSSSTIEYCGDIYCCF